jgi:hypothetical protein
LMPIIALITRFEAMKRCRCGWLRPLWWRNVCLMMLRESIVGGAGRLLVKKWDFRGCGEDVKKRECCDETG